MQHGSALIIELYGPPAAGKTTLARQMAAQMQAAGDAVKLVLSSRPSETIEHRHRDSAPATALAAIKRLTRPAREYIACIGRRRPEAGNSIAPALLAILPPMSWAWSMRLRQYIVRLEEAWRTANQTNGTVIFDQGFVQAICSLALQTRSPTPEAIEEALTLVPKATQWIRVDAPRNTLHARLEARRHDQGWIERRFELDEQMSLRSIEILDILESILRRRFSNLARLDFATMRDSVDSSVAVGSCKPHPV